MQYATEVPSLVLIADGFTRSGQDQRIVQAVRYGVRWVILRDHGARADIVELSARLLVQRMHKIAPSIRVVLNGPEDVAQRLGVGWHRTSHVPLTPASGSHRTSGRVAVRPQGRSTHSVEDVRLAAEEGLDYVLFGHVFETASHRGEPPRGVEALAEAAEAAPKSMSVIAIGGVSPHRVRACLDTGAAGVAVLSGIMQAPNLFQAVDAYMQALTPPFEAE